MLYSLVLLAVIGAAPAPKPLPRPPVDPTIAFFHFDLLPTAEENTPFRADRVRWQELSVGHSVMTSDKAAVSPNYGYFEFDGLTSIIHTQLRSNDPRLKAGFTWEGFFLNPSTNTCFNDGGVGDRLISQFADDAGNVTRLALGLIAFSLREPPRLTIALEGSERHVSNAPVAFDVWHHFAVVHEGEETTGKLTIYLDYKPCCEVEFTGKGKRFTLAPQGKAPLTIGARQKVKGKLDRGFGGLLDEIRLTARPLKPDEFLRTTRPMVPWPVRVEYFPDLPETFAIAPNSLAVLEPRETIPGESLSLPQMPPAYTDRGFTRPVYDRQAVRSRGPATLAPGRYQFLVRTRSDALLMMDGRVLVDARIGGKTRIETKHSNGQRDYRGETYVDSRTHQFTLLALIEPNDEYAADAVEVAYMPVPIKSDDDLPNVETPIDEPPSEKEPTYDMWHLLGTATPTAWNTATFASLRGRTRTYFEQLEPQRRAAAIERGDKLWAARRTEATRLAQAWQVVPPPTATVRDANPIDSFLAEKILRLQVMPAPIADDASFFRRLSLDLRGRIPTREEVEAFAKDDRRDKRARVVDRWLQSPEWADSWVGYWQDVLAENPSILRPTLNNTGAFRRWIHQSLVDNLPLDRFVTELILMEGSDEQIGPAGFALASGNDLPMAMKGQVITRAFLALDLKCARCHDSPHHAYAQRDLFSLAGMLSERPVTVPKSSVVIVPSGGREPTVTSSLKADEAVPPAWTLQKYLSSSSVDELAASERDAKHHAATPIGRPRAQLAQTITSAESPRFSQVIVNRVWKRFFGTALIEPVDHWSDTSESSHPALLKYLSREFAVNGFDLKALARRIVTSAAYEREIRDEPATHDPTQRTFAAQERRRLSAEQLVDSMFLAVGKEFEAEELNFDPQGGQNMLNLGTPRRAWQFASLSNERDRPALSLPVNQAIVDVLTTFGWRETRPDPITVREEDPNVLQPLLLANGQMAHRVVRLSESSATTELCLVEQPVEELVDKLFVTVLSRRPERVERETLVDLLSPAYEKRLTGVMPPPPTRRQRAHVDWEKHLLAESSVELMEAERLAREGEPPTVRLTTDFRERMEDALWSLLSSPEFVFVP
jgi:hypothetical protein